MASIPVTILTGFLGSGKTTLLKKILSDDHGYKIAVVENEFGEESIDNEILIQDDNERIVQMNNGCICCNIRGDLVEALSELIDRRGRGDFDFDHLVIETTGLANPAPIAQSFFMAEELADDYLIDAIITLVDAKHGDAQLSEHEVAQWQVGFADQIFITKTDLVDADTLAALQSRLKHINPRAAVQIAAFGGIEVAQVLDQRGFNLNAKLDIDPHFLTEDDESDHDHVHDEHCQHDHGHHHPQHDDAIKSFVYRAARPFNMSALDHALGQLVSQYGKQMLRYKGVLDVEGLDRRVVFQGVHETVGSDVSSKWEEGETRGSKIVFIGFDLPEAVIRSMLDNCLAVSDTLA